MFRLGLRVVAILVLALSGFAAAAQDGVNQESFDMKLSDFGFVLRAANTPEQMERLKRLPPRKFLARTQNGRRYYLYADPDYCQCVLVGNQVAMNNYSSYVSPGTAPPMPLGPDGGPVAGSLAEEIDPSLQIFDDDLFAAPYNYPD
jgi:hypothetical protein